MINKKAEIQRKNAGQNIVVNKSNSLENKQFKQLEVMSEKLSRGVGEFHFKLCNFGPILIVLLVIKAADLMQVLQVINQN